MLYTCQYCNETVNGRGQELHNLLFEHWKESCDQHPVYGAGS